ncbi:hypothetical protein AY601_1855 [Pedobacter cryoconitis]|uniref:Uncharacterized protein n=2 Tax=Pedobacter cryoconitis TaxID=188932 RepID=A0A127VBS8_9SPHI|nr:hypothetical protein AY601_1855 [Pedobacter cryoconitis]
MDFGAPLLDAYEKKHMISINNVQPLSSESLFDLLKTEFPAYVNEKLGSNLAVEFAHVSDIVNISFPEIIEGNAYTVTVGDNSLELTDHTTEGTYNTELLEQHLVEFLTLKAG